MAIKRTLTPEELEKRSSGPPQTLHLVKQTIDALLQKQDQIRELSLLVEQNLPIKKVIELHRLVCIIAQESNQHLQIRQMYKKEGAADLLPGSAGLVLYPSELENLYQILQEHGRKVQEYTGA